MPALCQQPVSLAVVGQVCSQLRAVRWKTWRPCSWSRHHSGTVSLSRALHTGAGRPRQVWWRRRPGEVPRGVWHLPNPLHACRGLDKHAPVTLRPYHHHMGLFFCHAGGWLWLRGVSGDRTMRHSLKASPGILKDENGGVVAVSF